MSILQNTGAVGGAVYVADDKGESLEGLPTPQPTPNLQAYLRERRIRLSRYPLALSNFLNYLKTNRRTSCPNFLPIRMDFENVSRCNFRCTMCKVSEWPKGRRANDMALSDFQKIIDQQTGLLEIKVQGLGEPTLQGDDFFAMIAYARARHIWVRTTTNASLLHLNDNYRKLIQSGANEIQISIDGADASSYEAIRQGANFAKVTQNCALLNQYAAQEGQFVTKMWTVVQKGNRQQLPQLVKLGAELGFKSMAFSLDLIDFGIEKWRTKNDAVMVNKEFTRKEALELLELGQNLGIKVAFWAVTSKYSPKNPNSLCPWPFERAYISSDLRVVPCCIISDPDICEVGSAQDFTATWQGKELAEFRRAHLNGQIPPVCRSCYE